MSIQKGRTEQANPTHIQMNIIEQQFMYNFVKCDKSQIELLTFVAFTLPEWIWHQGFIYLNYSLKVISKARI